MTDKEKILLDYMYEQANNLADFMHRNGYVGEDFRGAGTRLSIGFIDDAGNKIDLIESGFFVVKDGEVKRSVRKSLNPYTDKVDYYEYNYEEENEREREISEELPNV